VKEGTCSTPSPVWSDERCRVKSTSSDGGLHLKSKTSEGRDV